MATLWTLVLLGLVALFVLFAARWRPQVRPIEEPPLPLDEVPIAVATGAPLHREASEREAAMKEALLASGVVPRKEWARAEPSLIFVPDDLSDAELGERIVILGGESSEPDAGTGARERFRKLLVAQGLTERADLLGTFLAPGPFDVYRVRRPV